MPFVSATSSTPNVFEILAKGDITFIGAGSTEKMIVIGPADFVWSSALGPVIISKVNGEVVPLPWDSPLYAPLDIPDGATITAFECIVKNDDSDNLFMCELYETAHGSLSSSLLSSLSTTIDSASLQTLTDSSLNELVDRDSNRYHVIVRADNAQICFDRCLLVSIKITYTVPSSGITVGGEFIPVDNVSLVLAYSLVNSWWMAPIGIGIGVGIYLTRRRIIH